MICSDVTFGNFRARGVNFLILLGMKTDIRVADQVDFFGETQIL